MLHALKQIAYYTAARSRISTLIANSEWRKKRLSILCYHGLSLDDEHIWNPGLFMTGQNFRSRIVWLRRSGYNILPLGESVERLANGTLPARAVAITFDDGNYDFLVNAAPVLQEFSVPATVYMTTYYSAFNRPVFDPMLSYLLWKASGKTLSGPEPLRAGVLLNKEGRSFAWKAISGYALQAGLSGADKDGLLHDIAARLGLDYDSICARRILHRMNPDEVSACAGMGVDIQLHTHRHRVPREEDEFVRELEDNRIALCGIGHAEFKHFCYPSGVYYPESKDYLRNYGLVSATTCDPGLASPSTDPYYLPRFCDSTVTPYSVFDAWNSGASMFFRLNRR